MKKNLFISLTMLLLAALSMAGCDAIYDDEGDCSVSYKVRFRYDMNMKFADAFAHEVHAVTLYVLDSNDNIVWKGSDKGDALAQEGYEMTVNVAPGKYRMLAWCTTNEANSYSLETNGRSADFLSCSLNGAKSLVHDDEEAIQVSHDLDLLFHGELNDVELSAEPGIHTITIPLVKDTNRFRVVLQHVSNAPISSDDFSFTIEADNGLLLSDNSVQPGNEVIYHPWHTSNASSDIEAVTRSDEAGGNDDNNNSDSNNNNDIQVNAVVAELSVSRLVVEDDPRLKVYNNKSNEIIFSVPIKDFVLLVRGYENADMPDQEYLDRQDEYNMTFFLDERDRWMNAYIYINSWRIVLQNTSL